MKSKLLKDFIEKIKNKKEIQEEQKEKPLYNKSPIYNPNRFSDDSDVQKFRINGKIVYARKSKLNL